MQNTKKYGIIHRCEIQGYSSAGRVPVSKTVGRGFESSCPCHNRSQTASVFLLSGVFACFSVWNAFFDEFSGGFFMDTRVSSFCFVQSVTIIPFGTSSKKHQSFKKVSRRPQIFHICGRPFLCLLRCNFCVVIGKSHWLCRLVYLCPFLRSTSLLLAWLSVRVGRLLVLL